MKIRIKKSKITQLVNEEIDKVLSEQKKFNTKGVFIVRKQRNGNTYPGLQRMFDNRTLHIMGAIENLKEAESGSWYQDEGSDAEDYEQAYQELIAAKTFLERLQKIIKNKQRRLRKSNPEFAKWDFAKNYGAALPEAKEKYPNFIKKITLAKSNVIKDGVDPTVHFNDGSKKTFKTPKRRLTSTNITKKLWKNSVLVFDGQQLSWMIGGLGGQPFDSSSPIGGPWDAGSGNIGDSNTFLAWIKRGRTADAQSKKSAGPIPEGWYTVGGDVIETVPPELRGLPEDANSYWQLPVEIKKKLLHKFDPDFGRNFYGRNKNLNKKYLKYEKAWRDAAWGKHRLAIHGGSDNRTKGPTGTKVKNMAQIYKRGYFYIHGGDDRITSGCIGLGDDMEKFHEFWTKKWLEAGRPNQKVSLYVNYRDNDMKKISDLISQTEFRNKETESLPKEDPEVKASGDTAGDPSWEVPANHMRKVRGCKGSSPVAASLKWTDKQFYGVMSKVIPEKLLSQDRFKNWNVGKPGKKSRLLVAMLQMNIFNGDLSEVDGCFGQKTYSKLLEK